MSQLVQHGFLDRIGKKEMALASLCGLLPIVLFVWRKKALEEQSKRSGSIDVRTADYSALATDDDANSSIYNKSSRLEKSQIVADTSLLKKHSRIISITTGRYTYASLRIFHRTHPKEALLPPKLPLIVFVHGLGGQVAQFQYLIEFFVHISHVLGIDLPGCGQSAMKPTDWDAYTPEALVELLETVIAQFLEEGQQFVIVAHSMGCSLATKLITAANEGALAGRCAGFVAICPKAELSTKEAKALASIVNIPGFIFDLWRRYDRRGGLNSDSVVRFVGATSSLKVKALQYRFNSQSRTPTWRRMVKKAKFATKDEWAKVKCPIYLLAGSEDKVCPVTEMDKIYNWLAESTVSQEQGQVRAVEKVVIPNAGHGVLYELPHITSKYIGEFLKTHVSEVLDLGWQLSYLKEDKWMLKNLNKWNKVQPVSELVGPSKFRAMKTLRQNDENHNPMSFAEKYPDVGHIVDISHEQPPYDPESLGSEIAYHKFPTVSKIPPTLYEVHNFIELIDKIISEQPKDVKRPCIAVHCHYGFNRTGFFLVSYLIERLGLSVPQALAAFKRVRDPGIRHPHFINELFERYTLGIDRNAS